MKIRNLCGIRLKLDLYMNFKCFSKFSCPLICPFLLFYFLSPLLVTVTDTTQKRKGMTSKKLPRAKQVFVWIFEYAYCYKKIKTKRKMKDVYLLTRQSFPFRIQKWSVIKILRNLTRTRSQEKFPIAGQGFDKRQILDPKSCTIKSSIHSIIIPSLLPQNNLLSGYNLFLFHQPKLNPL